MGRPRKIQQTTIMWLGEDNLHDTGYGPRVNTWNGIEFPINEPVPVDNPAMIEVAKTNPFYEVIEPAPKDDEPEAVTE